MAPSEDFFIGLGKFSDFLIISHRNPDGDSIGSQLALYTWLIQNGKKAAIYSKDKIPEILRFLENAEKIIITDELRPGTADAAIIADCSSWERSGFERPSGLPVFNIDHHEDNRNFGDWNFVSAPSSSTSELVYQVLTHRVEKITQPIASQLLAGVIADTGGFRYSNTNIQSLETAGSLLAYGIPYYKVCENLFCNDSFSKVKLHSLALAAADLQLKGKLCLLYLDPATLKKAGAVNEDAEGLADKGLNIRGVEVSLLFRTIEGKTKINLRSAGRIDVGSVARELGGGGHSDAAACTIDYSQEEAGKQLTEMINRQL